MRYRVLVCAGLAFVPSMPAEAQKLQTALAIVMEQPTMARTMTRERDIIPGLGINREIFVDQTGSGCDLVSSGVRAYRRTDDVRH